MDNTVNDIIYDINTFLDTEYGYEEFYNVCQSAYFRYLTEYNATEDKRKYLIENELYLFMNAYEDFFIGVDIFYPREKEIPPCDKMILDYGCGIGTRGFFYSHIYSDIYLYEINTMQKAFVEFRIDNYCGDYNNVVLVNNPFDYTYNYIFLYDTIGYLDNDELSKLNSCLDWNGEMFDIKSNRSSIKSIRRNKE